MRINGNINIDSSDIKINDLVKATKAYNPTGSSGWYKIVHSKAPGRWNDNGFSLLITSGMGYSACAILFVGYYNNVSMQFKKLLGNISLDNLKAIKNDDDSLDIYVRSSVSYQPLYVTVLSVQGDFFLNPIEVEYVGSSLPSGGTQYSFTDI